MEVCSHCGTFLPPRIELPSHTSRSRDGPYSRAVQPSRKCPVCPDGGRIQDMMVPYVYKFLIAELGSVNLKITMKPGQY